MYCVSIGRARSSRLIRQLGSIQRPLHPFAQTRRQSSSVVKNPRQQENLDERKVVVSSPPLPSYKSNNGICNFSTTNTDSNRPTPFTTISNSSQSSNTTTTISTKQVERWQRDLQDGTAPPDRHAYQTLLRHWSHRGELARMNDVLSDMRVRAVPLPPDCVAPCVYGFARAGQVETAEGMVRDLVVRVQVGPWEGRDRVALQESVQNVLRGHRARLVRTGTIHQIHNNNKNGQASQIVAAARAFVDDMEKANVLDVESNDRMLGTMMDMYAHAGDFDAANDIFRRLDHPSVVTMGILMKAYGNKDMAHRSTELLHVALDHPKMIPSIKEFTSVINAWSQSSRPDALDQACSVLRLIDEHSTCQRLGIRPNVVTFSTLLKCLVATKRKDAGQRAQEMLNDMERRFNEGDATVKPNRVTFTLVIKACLQSNDLKGANSILKRMEESEVPPNPTTYSEILKFYANLSSSHAAEQAERTLDHMRYMSQTNNNDPRVAPNTYSYNIAALCWAKSGDPRAAERVLRLQKRMVEEGLSLDLYSYSNLIKVYAKTDEAARATELLYKILNETLFEPDVRLFAEVMDAWALSSRSDTVEQIFQVFHDMQHHPATKKLQIQPNAFTYSTLLKCLIASKREDTGRKAYELLKGIEPKTFSNDRKGGEIVYILAIRACLEAGDSESGRRCMHEMMQSSIPLKSPMFYSLLNFYTKEATEESVMKADVLLVHMNWLATVDPSFKPDPIAYNIVLAGWASCENVDRLVSVTDRMKVADVDPSLPMFTTLITAFCKSDQSEHIEKAEDLLREMESLCSKKNEVRPTYNLYMLVTKAWLRIGDVKSSTRALVRQIEYVAKTKDRQASPDPKILGLVLEAWIKDGQYDPATSLLVSVQSLYQNNVLPFGPTVRNFAIVIDAWRNSKSPTAEKRIQQLDVCMEKLRSGISS